MWIRALTTATLLTGLLVPAPAAAAGTLAAIEERVYVETTVDSDHDGRPDRVALDIARPADGAKVPVIFEHSPYRTGLNAVTNHDVNVDRLPQETALAGPGDGPTVLKAMPDLPGWYDDYFVPRGYAVVLGHSIGTGASEGCPTSGDAAETQSTKAVIDWLNGRARGYSPSGQPVTASWSTGKVGMTGISYNGTLPNMVATTGVDGLKTIVPISAISSWYDYYRANGLVVAPGGYQGEDADILAKAVVQRPGCADEIADLTARQDRTTGDYQPFWQDRDYTRLASGVKASVFVMHGQSDWNVKGKQYASWWDALARAGVPRKIWLHNAGHGAPSRSDYQATLGRWFDYWLKGVNNGIMDEPMADVQYADGTWKQLANWPDPAVRDVNLSLTAAGDLSTTPVPSEIRHSFTDEGRTKTPATLVANPDTANPNRLVYRTATLPAAVRLSGTPRVSLQAAVTNRPDANLTALLVDYGTGTPVIVTRGWLDPQNRTGPDTTTPVVQGQEYTLRFDLQPKDHVFATGHRIGLVVISTDYDFTLRPLGGTGLRLAPAYSTLTLPSVGLTTGTVVYSDDFETDRGWQVNPDGTDTATAGRFERGNPETTTSGGTMQDGTTPSGSFDLVTGALAGASVGANDLDGGVSSVRSPAIALPAGGNYTLTFACYLAHLNNASSADYLRVRVLHAGGTATVFTRTGSATQVTAAWSTQTVDLSAYAGQSIRLVVEAADTDPGSLIEAGVDDVRILRS
ncbi:hypothetical protein Lfu02_43110 [Longispora fulva]|uniref:Xaa-Pro dipeptidyl-peptidase n=1 Tax=Longispora fulva TaxID=619741 RepID=A0A8J7GRC8_9ACTN|nr:Xaa-Pro dipeptidyl-peptidase [Longispora fulva]MBG6136768.1 X-Pro dipeptidyl-peptidase [Longispora fulva]GIG59939.1 hypothetical protein Lfu02_43110 [Longispora fulva]